MYFKKFFLTVNIFLPLKKNTEVKYHTGQCNNLIFTDHDITNRSWKPVELHEISPNPDKQFDNYQLVAEVSVLLIPSTKYDVISITLNKNKIFIFRQFIY